MGRGSRQEHSHWTESHPDQKHWTPHQRALAGMMTQEAYEGLYGRGAAPEDFFSEDGEYLLVRQPGRYNSFQSARSGGEGVVSVRLSGEGIIIENISPSARESQSGPISFSLNPGQLDCLFRLLREDHPGLLSFSPPLSATELWDGANSLDGPLEVVGPLQHPHAQQFVQEQMESLKMGKTMAFDEAGDLLVYAQDYNGNCKFVPILRHERKQVCNTREEAAEAIISLAAENDMPLSPRQARPGHGNLMLEIGKKNDTILFAHQEGGLLLQTDGKEALSGFWQDGELFLIQPQSSPIGLSPEESELLLRFLVSMRED